MAGDGTARDAEKSLLPTTSLYLRRGVFRPLFFVLAVAVACLLGCQRDMVAPPLVDISDVTPRELELGDRLEMRGAGFPQGRPAHVTFEGSVHRAGEKPMRGIAIEGNGVVTSPDRLEIAIDERLLERFCGRGD